MSEKQTFSIFHLTEEQAIELLDTEPQHLEDPSDRYIAASQLAQYPSERTIQALIKAIEKTDSNLDNRITRRKAIESLGKIKAAIALPIIRGCLQDKDCYTVENAVWAIGEIGTQSIEILNEITHCLQRPEQNYRLIIHTLAKLQYKTALDSIAPFIQSSDLSVQSAAISTTCQLTQDNSAMEQVVPLLHNDSVVVRRSCVQDLIDTHYHPAIPAIATSPISMVFRLRGVQQIAQASQSLSFKTIQPPLEQVIRDHPSSLEMVHEYDQTPSLDFAINELYETDFGRCYLASQTLLDIYPDEAPDALLANYQQRGKGDYGAHYHIIKILGWLKHQPAYDLIVEALHNPLPQFQKSRTAAAIALGELGNTNAIAALKQALSSNIWILQYASILALEKLKSSIQPTDLGLNPHALIQAKLDTKP
ncbi:MAG: HEAT repeat domain-containing protein [Chloroflexota bacterium]